MSIILGIAIGVAACLVALLLIWRNNEKWAALHAAQLQAIADKINAVIPTSVSKAAAKL